jgi:hypothetical protein
MGNPSYIHGKGIAVFWPFSEARLALPLPWFATADADTLICWHNVRVFGTEFACFGLLLGVVLFLCCPKQVEEKREIE